MIEPTTPEAAHERGDGKPASPTAAMPRVAAAAALLAKEIARHVAAIPKKQTAEGRRLHAAAADAALLRRCASTAAHPASTWAPVVDAFVAWLARDRTDEKSDVPVFSRERNGDASKDDLDDDHDNSDDNRNTHDDDNDDDDNVLVSDDGGGWADHPNNAASTASNFLRPLARMDIGIYAITTHPENAHLIGCCTKTPPLIEADCAYGDWRFVAAMERDVDCTGGILFIERAVHAPTGTSIDARCDLRCQNTSRRTRALLFAFLKSGQTSLSAFLQDVFAPFDRVIDVLHARGWDTRGKRFVWSDVHSAISEQRVACTRNDGIVVHLFYWSSTIVASGVEYGPVVNVVAPPASAYGPDPGPEVAPQDSDNDDDDDREADDDRDWLVDGGHIAPSVLAARWGDRPHGCPALLLDPVHGTDDDLVACINAVADQIARRHGLASGDDAMAARAYGHSHLNGWTCQAALDKVLNTGTRSWRLAMRHESIVSGERCIDPDRGLYANWMVVCDMLPVGNSTDGTVRTTGLPFVRFQGHLLGVDERAASGPVQQAHVVVILCEAQEPPTYAMQQRAMPPADGERSRIATMLHALTSNSNAPKARVASDAALHPISAYYRRRCVDSRDGLRMLTVLHEASSTPPANDSDAASTFIAAVEWLMAEFETCAQTFGADASDTRPAPSGWTLEFEW
ncbi:hypothetical protein psal_cds_1085 [Pandoravirus salinus]|uniref:Uncharacterized protein n=1 Tax=Pandoravirus salinus TaxID=1349410 RepID=S4W0I7_9VIRU|nr:hypothetical protein psal_cds_1085 [Pandoravirus salinus]AGO85301.2 hypothetical protein psal_cds_1085 [Pandoravirus salinus]